MLELQIVGDVVVVALRGDLDVATGRDVGSAIRARIPDGASALVLDLTGVGFLDSSAVQMLFDLQRDLTNSRRTMAIVIAPDALPRRSIEICDPDHLLDLRPTREEAMRAVAEVV